jgi:hypothetical protein
VRDIREIVAQKEIVMTGSFFVGLRFDRYVMSPSGEIAADTLVLHG